MTKFVAGLAILLPPLLAACSAPENPGKAVIPSSVPVQRMPGSWNMVHYTTAFDAENVVGGMADMVHAGKASVGKKEFGGPLCLAAQRAAKDDLTARLNEAIGFGPEWKVIRSSVAAGNVDFAATMDDPQAGKGTLTIVGQITPTTTDLLVTTDSYQPAPGKGHIHTVMKQENTRIGDCSPGQDPWQW
ncbi:MAG: hypothetical protein ACKOUT_03785 [Novosphingobium sp.]